MTPERAHFHQLMLEAGEIRRFHAELNAALETEEPLSELTLALSLCTRAEEYIHVLREYLLDHPADMDAVERMVRQELRARLDGGEITQERCLQMMRILSGGNCAGCLSDLYQDVCAVEEYRDLADKGYLSEEASLLCLEALLNAEPLPDVWALDKVIRQAKRRGEAYPGQNHPAVLTIPAVNDEYTQRRTNPMKKPVRRPATEGAKRKRRNIARVSPRSTRETIAHASEFMMYEIAESHFFRKNSGTGSIRS